MDINNPDFVKGFATRCRQLGLSDPQIKQAYISLAEADSLNDEALVRNLKEKTASLKSAEIDWGNIMEKGLAGLDTVTAGVKDFYSKNPDLSNSIIGALLGGVLSRGNPTYDPRTGRLERNWAQPLMGAMIGGFLGNNARGTFNAGKEFFNRQAYAAEPLKEEGGNFLDKLKMVFTQPA